MPQGTGVAMPAAEQAQRLAARRRARDGSLRARPTLWRGAVGRPPTAIAGVRCGARSRGCRTGWA